MVQNGVRTGRQTENQAGGAAVREKQNLTKKGGIARRWGKLANGAEILDGRTEGKAGPERSPPEVKTRPQKAFMTQTGNKDKKVL